MTKFGELFSTLIKDSKNYSHLKNNNPKLLRKVFSNETIKIYNEMSIENKNLFWDDLKDIIINRNDVSNECKEALIQSKNKKIEVKKLPLIRKIMNVLSSYMKQHNLTIDKMKNKNELIGALKHCLKEIGKIELTEEERKQETTELIKYLMETFDIKENSGENIIETLIGKLPKEISTTLKGLLMSKNNDIGTKELFNKLLQQVLTLNTSNELKLTDQDYKDLDDYYKKNNASL